MSLTYGIISLVSLILIGVCFAVDRKRDILLLLMFFSVFVCNLGHFLVSIAPNIDFALNANRLAYLGQVFLPFFLLMMILNLCNIKYKKRLPFCLSIVSFAMLLVAGSPGFLPWYYKSASLVIADGVSQIIREYGPLHTVYYIYLFGYFLSTLCVVIYAIYKKKVVSKLHVTFLLSAILCNTVIWIVEQFLPRGFEFLTVSYIMTELFILLLYGILQEYSLINQKENNIKANTHQNTEEHLPRKISFEEINGRELFSTAEIDKIFSNCDALSELTNRESEVLKCILANKPRKKIAEELYVTESTIKKYTSSVYKKLTVNNRMELFAKLKNYIG